jgi:hypothetical protein
MAFLTGVVHRLFGERFSSRFSAEGLGMILKHSGEGLLGANHAQIQSNSAIFPALGDAKAAVEPNLEATAPAPTRIPPYIAPKPAPAPPVAP